MTDDQPSLDGNDHHLLEHRQCLRNWRAFVAPLAAGTTTVIEDPELVHLATDVIAVFAEHAGLGGLTRAQLHRHLESSARNWDPRTIDTRLSLLIDMGFLESYLRKAHQKYYVLQPAGLAGALAAERLAAHGGVDELVALMDRTMRLLRHSNPDPKEALHALRSCRQSLIVFAQDLQRQVATATPAELVIAQRQHDHTDFTPKVLGLNRMVTRAFSGQPLMEDTATSLIEAAQFYRDQQIAAVTKVLDQGGASLNLDVLTAAEYDDLAETAGADLLGHFGAFLVTDAAPLWIDGQAVVEAAAARTPPVPRTRPEGPRPVPGPREDPLEALDKTLAHEDLRRQVLMEDLLAGDTHTHLADLLEAKGWPGAARLLADLLAADADPRTPHRIDIAVQVRVDPHAKVTYLHDVLLHLDTPHPERDRG